MKDGSIGKTIVKGLVGAAIVATPAVGGQLTSALGKAFIGPLKSAPNIVVDGIGCTAVAGIMTGVAYAMGGKQSAAKVGALAIVGAALGTFLPSIDDGIDAVVRKVVTGSAGDVTTQLNANRTAQITGMSRTPLKLAKAGGFSDGLGGVPGGVNAVNKIGGVL